MGKKPENTGERAGDRRAGRPMKASYHLPGLFEFYELYRLFLPLFRERREYFYDWCEIG